MENDHFNSLDSVLAGKHEDNKPPTVFVLDIIIIGIIIY